MTRLISGAILAGAAVAAIVLLPIDALRIVAAVVAGFAAHEYVRVAGAAVPQRGLALLIPVTVFACIVASGVPVRIDPIWWVVAALGWVALEVLFGGHTVHHAGVALIAPIYIGVPLGMLVAIQDALGWRGTLLVIATIVVSDSAQYYSGRAFGRRPLAPTISPKKTIEGAVGGVVLGTVFMAVAGPRLFPMLPLLWIVVGLTVVVLGILGDLFESRLKRTAGMKDSSTLIPGHGGVLDRIDALLFATPAFYLFVRATG
jgi:phosphatidate cytidylyltransferase